MRTIHTAGNPFDCGKQHGSQCRDLAQAWLRQILDRGRDDVSHQIETCAQVGMWLRQIEAVRSDLIDECRGIAEGLGMADQDYFTAIYLEQSGWLPMACTLCGVVDSRGHPVIGKTDDIYTHERGMNVLEVVQPDRGYRHIHIHFAGTIWTTSGMNEKGLAIAMTGLPGATTGEDGLPSLFVLRTILPECATVAEALRHVEELPMNAHGFSLQMADRSGQMELIEATPEGVVTVAPDVYGFRTHTNHILDADFARRNPPQAEPILTNGMRRLRTATQLLPNLDPTEDGVSELLQNRDAKGPISQEGEEGLFTDYAVILKPIELQMTLWSGPPSQVEPEQMSFPDRNAPLGAR
jgi:predicted choloylglycine hydrolase